MLVCHIFTGFERSTTLDKILIILRRGGDRVDNRKLFITCVQKCQNNLETVKCSGEKFKKIVITTFDMSCFLYDLEYGEM